MKLFTFHVMQISKPLHEGLLPQTNANTKGLV